MESTVSYIIVAIIVVLVITVYNYKKKQIRYYLLSIQRYTELNISVNIKKHKGKISAILVKLTANKAQVISELNVELISSKREFNYYSLKPIIETSNFPYNLEKGNEIEFLIPFEDFRSLLMDGEHPFRTFRFVAVTDKKQSYKSHEMGFDKKWVIYRPDSGSYNYIFFSRIIL